MPVINSIAFLKKSLGRFIWLWLGVLLLGLLVLAAPSVFSQPMAINSHPAMIVLQSDYSLPDTLVLDPTQPSVAQQNAAALFSEANRKEVNRAKWFIVVGFMLLIAEMFFPTFGGLFIIGLLSTLWGTWLLYNVHNTDGKHLAPNLIGTLLLLSLFVGLIVRKIRTTAYRQKAKNSYEKLIGMIGRVVMPISPQQTGKIKVNGEIWDAQSSEALPVESRVQVVAVDATSPVVLTVVPVNRN